MAQNKSTSDASGRACLILFGLPFFCAGLFAAYAGIKQTIEGRANAWVAILVGTVFTLVGGGIIVLGFYADKLGKKKKERQMKFPAEPWKWNESWADGVVKGPRSSGAIAMGLFALFWNLISWPAVIAMISQHEFENNNAAYLIFLFPLIGIGLIIMCAYVFLRSQKYGRSSLMLETLPGVIGGPFKARLSIPASVYPESGFKVQIVTVQEYTSGTGKNRRTSERLIWEDEVTITECTRRNRQTEFDISFMIPSHCPETTDDKPGADVIWRIKVRGETAGIDYTSSFDIPVFRTADSRDDVNPDRNLGHDTSSLKQNSQALAEVCKELGVDYERGAKDRLKIHFPAGRQLTSLIGLFIFFLIWTGIIIGMIMFGNVPMLFPIFFGLFDLIMLFILLTGLFGSSSIEVKNHRVEVIRRFMGLGSPKAFRFEEIKDIRPKVSMQSGNKTYYIIEFSLTNGQQINAGRRIPGKPKVKQLIAAIDSAITAQSDESF